MPAAQDYVTIPADGGFHKFARPANMVTVNDSVEEVKLSGSKPLFITEDIKEAKPGSIEEFYINRLLDIGRTNFDRLNYLPDFVINTIVKDGEINEERVRGLSYTHLYNCVTIISNAVELYEDSKGLFR